MTLPRRGDPDGRRLAKRQANYLAEAGRLSRALDVLLQRAEFEVASCRDLSARIAEAERIALEKSYGRIESRKRFKAQSSHHLLEGRNPNFFFIDENGKSFPEPSKSNAVFTMGSVSISPDGLEKYHIAADKIKMKFFGTRDVTFHEPEMRQLKEPCYFSGDKQKQMDFDNEVSQLIIDTKFTAFGVGIRKSAYHEEFVKIRIDHYLPVDVYAVATHMLLERYVDFLAHSSDRCIGKVAFESQGAREDAEHQLEYARVIVDGTQWVSEKAFRHWLAPGVRFTPKQGSDPMELADMFSRDLYEWVESECTAEPKRWALFNRKIYCRDDGQMGKFGVKVFPDSDIRGRIEAHRSGCGARKN